MKHFALLAIIAAIALGCNKPEDAPPTDAPAPVAETAQGGGNGGGIAPMTTAPIPNAPISGSESVQGGGSAVGHVAKDRAKTLGGGSSIDQMPSDDQSP